MRYICWDSNCFIGFLGGEEHGREARLGVIQAVEAGDARLVTSAFTLVEVVKFKTRGEDGPYVYKVGSDQRQTLEDCFSPENGVLLVNVDLETARMAREAVRDYGVDTKDAIHVGSAMQFARTALLEGESLTFQTFDKKLIKHARGIKGIVFEEPNTSDFPYQMSADI